jgi:Cu(I)/Ag(I) efflux system membrane fusion protein/cobalt-zinc-cadmium efflux system membrane fusion protein
MHSQVIRDEPGQCPICGMNLVPMDRAGAGSDARSQVPEGERKILYWVAPMDPSYISDEAGKSPMGMDLVPVYEGGEPGAGSAIKIDPVMVQNMGVRSDEAKTGRLTKTVRAAGTFEVNEESLAIVNTKVEGWIERLHVDQTGQQIKRGDPLLSIYSPELVSTQEEYLSALRHFESVKDSPYQDVVESARSLLSATRKRLRYWDVSRSQIRKLARTGRVTKNLTLFAPVSGVVMHKNAVEGMKVMPGQDLFKIADLSGLWLQARFYEQDAPWVEKGAVAEVQVDHLPGASFTGTVDYIYPYLENKTRDLTARIVVENKEGRLKPGMFATVIIRHQAREPSVLIPDEAVIRTGERDMVFIDLGEGRFAPREVKLGLLGDGRMVEVRDGLKAGDRVVTSAQFMLDSESTIREAVRKMLETGGAAGSADDEQVRASAPQEELYVCPMEEDKEIVSDQPGDCPKCGMNLVPVGEVEYDHPLKHRH